MKAVVVIPTYDEADALESILDRLFEVAPGFDVLVVDDNSPDGTGRIAEDYGRRNGRVSVLHRPGKLGLGSAYRDGFRRVLADGADAVFEMDADHSHNPRYLPAMRRRLETDLDLVIGSRYVNGVRVENWPFRRLLLSRFANIYVNWSTGLPASVVSDATSGFRGYRREVLEAIGLDRVRSAGFAFQVEMKYRALRKGFRIEEVPIIFVDRQVGTSKMSRQILIEGLARVWQIRSRVRREEREKGG